MVRLRREFLRWVRVCCLVSMTWAGIASLLPRAAEARTGKIVLTATGDEGMVGDLKGLLGRFRNSSRRPATL